MPSIAKEFWFEKGLFGAGRMPRDKCEGDKKEERAREMLSRVLNLGNLVIFVGAGCSRAFGYPLWSDLAKEICKWCSTNETSSRDEKAHFDRLRQQMDRGGWDGMVFIFGEAKRWVHKDDSGERRSFLEKKLKGLFSCQDDASRHQGAEPKTNPYAALLALKIKRFATTNYDFEIEYALAQEDQKSSCPCKPDRKCLGWNHRGAFISSETSDDAAVLTAPADISFTQRPEFTLKQAEFFMARKRSHEDLPLVFHLHGRCDDFDSMVLSEDDYRNWYLNDSSHASYAFRQTVDLLLGSNPLLFVGYGLGDEDLLRTLRILGATDSQRKDWRPIFVLEHYRKTKENQFLADELFERYGVHVLWYPKDGRNGDQTTQLCVAVNDLVTEWTNWQKAWTSKPKWRSSIITGPRRRAAEKLLHYAHDLPGFPCEQKGRKKDQIMARNVVIEDLQSLANKLDHRPPVLVLLGPGGSGKSHRAAEVFKLAARSSQLTKEVKFPFRNSFFWSSYYSDDWLNGLTRAESFLGQLPGPKPRGHDLLTRFEEMLSSRDAILIFDGFERLLQPVPEKAEVGRAYLSSIKRFLAMLVSGTARSRKSKEKRCTVILTSRLWPAEFGELSDAEVLPTWEKPRPRTTVILLSNPKVNPTIHRNAVLHRIKPWTSVELNGESNNPTWKQACALLSGHAYGMRLAKALLDGKVPDDDILLPLQRTPADRRVSRMIELTITQYEKNSGMPAVARKFLEHACLFMRPLNDEILEACYCSASEGRKESNNEDLRTLKESLNEFRLLVPVSDSTNSDVKWTTHPLVRGYVFHRLHGADSEELPNFTLPGFTSGTAAVYPGSKKAGEMVFKLIDYLINKAWSVEDKNEKKALAGAAFSVMRARMEAITVPKWTSYDKYIQLSLRMINLIKALQKPKDLWTHSDKPSDAVSDDAILNAGEVAWLYNDLGLALCCEGSMHDAFAVWEQGYEINRLIESGERAGHFVVQSKLHLCHTMLELGNINAAEQFMEETEEANFWLDNEDFAGRILGYKGLLAHLRGNLESADTFFKASIEKLGKPGGNTRAESIFRRYRADLLIRREQWGEAKNDIGVSRALAESSGDRDLVAYARKSFGHWYRAQKKCVEGRHEYEAALKAARDMGIRRLEADILSELSHLALDLGDWESARRNALDSMRIANELGLGLRQCHGLVVLGKASIQAGQRDLGIGYLKTAEKLSRNSGYWLRAFNAEEELRKLDEEPISV